jgi:hypothetical protein
MIYNIGQAQPFRLSKASKARIDKALEETGAVITAQFLDFNVGKIEYHFIQVDIPSGQVAKFKRISRVNIAKPLHITGQ